MLRVGMLGDVGEGLLHDAENGYFDLAGEAGGHAVDGDAYLDLVLIGELLDVAAQGRLQAEIVQDHGAQVEYEAAGVLEGAVDHALEAGKLGLGAGGVEVEEALAYLGAQYQIGHGLCRAVVYLA